MLIERLSLRNFLRYRRKCEIDFSGKSTCGIVGANEVGKTTILQAICYALHGRTRAEREEQLISDGAKGDLIVELALRLEDGSLFEIERGRTLSNSPILACTGYQANKVAEVQSVIHDKVGITYEDFITLSYFVQGDIHQFMDGNKRDYFNRWTTNLAVWVGWEDKANTQQKLATKKLDAIRREIDQAQDTLADEAAIKAELRAATGNLRTLEKRYKLLEQSAKRLESQVEKQAKGEAAKEELARCKDAITDLRVSLEGIEDSIRSKENRLASTSLGACPILGISCKDLKKKGDQEGDKVKAALSLLNERKVDIEARIATLRVRYTEAKKSYSKTKPIESESAKLELRETRIELSRLSSSMKAATLRVGRAEARVEVLAKARKQLEDKKKEADHYEAELRRWQFLRFMCGKSGVPATLIEEQLDLVEEQCNWVLDHLDYQKQICFRGYKTLKTYESTCLVCGDDNWRKGTCSSCGAERQHKRKDEPTVTILDGASERPFCLESGGARVLESFAVRLACSLFRSNMLNVPLRLIMLDEVFSMLDADNRRKLMSLIIDRLKSQFGLKQQLVVSHHEDILHSVDHLLRVKLVSGSAEAMWD